MTKLTKSLCALSTILLFHSCSLTTTKLKDGAYIVYDLNSKQPLKGLYVEVTYTADEGSSYDVLASTRTDEDGWFEFDEQHSGCFDCWSHVHVYSDENYSDTLGGFEYAFPDGALNGARILHADTFVLEHEVVVIPRIGSSDVTGDYMSINFHNVDLNSGNQNQSFTQAVNQGTQFPTESFQMTMQLQHWLRFGTGYLAIGVVFDSGVEVESGYFKLSNYSGSVAGDTVYIDYTPRD